jgi:membrane protein
MDRLEIERARRPSVRLAFDFYQRDRAFAGSLLAGGIAVKLFLWVLPFSLTFIVFLGGLADGLDMPPAELAHDVGLTAVVAGMVEKAVDNSSRGRVYLGILGVVLLIWAGMGVARALRLVSRLSWKMASAPNVNLVRASLGVIGSVVAILAFQWAWNRLPSGPLIVEVLAVVAFSAALLAILMSLFNTLPHPAEVPWTAMLPGAIIMAAGLLVTRLVTIVYFSRRLESADDLYGGLGLVTVFLAWLYIIGRTLVAAISLNATIWEKDALQQGENPGLELNPD